MSRHPDEQAVHDLVAQVYEAAFEPGRWRACQTMLRDLTGAASAAHVFIDLENAAASVVEELSADRATHQLYEQYYWQLDCFRQASMGFPVGRVWASHRLIADRELERSEFYCDFLRRADQFYYAGAMLLSGPAAHAATGVLRARRQGAFDDGDLAVLRAVVPHLMRAVAIHRRVQPVLAGGAVAVLDSLMHGVVVLDRAGRVALANAEAERLIALDDGLRIVAGRLRAVRAADDHVLQRLQAEAGAGTGSIRIGGSMALPRPSGRPSFGILAAPLPQEPLAYDVASLAAASVVFIHDPARRRQPPLELLRLLYGLTPAEARLAAQLARGSALAAAADLQAITLGSARVYLKRIFRKTGTRRQAELVALLAALPTVPVRERR